VDAGTVDGRGGVHEVPREPQRELLDRADTVAGEGVHRVLLRVGRQHPGVVADQVRGRQVPGERGADVEVGDPVLVRTAVHTDQPYLGLAVLVGPESDVHQLPR
jgi:hypothetical protein